MKKSEKISSNIKILFVLLSLTIITFNVKAQVTDPSEYFELDEDKKVYSEIIEDLKKGDALFEEAGNAGSTSKEYKLLKKASKIHDIAYRKQYDLLASSAHEYAQKSEGIKKRKIRELNYIASEKFGAAVSLRRAAVMSERSEAIELYRKAHKYDKETQYTQLNAFGVYFDKDDYELSDDDPYTIAAIENRKEYSEKDFSESKFKIVEKQEDYLPSGVGNGLNEDGTFFDFSNSNTKYSVQIASAKRTIAIKYLTKRYPGLEEIREEYVGGLYRYTFGEYNTYKKATQEKEECNVKGAFVVAYNGDRRLKHITYVLMPEQDQLFYDSGSLASNNTSGKSNNTSGKSNNTKIVNNSTQNPIGAEYRVQIGVSRLPAYDSQLRKMNPTSLPVKVCKSSNYYKYTIGSFETYREAKNFKNANGLNKSFIVRYKNGRETR